MAIASPNLAAERELATDLACALDPVQLGRRAGLPGFGFRPSGECTRWRLDDVGLDVDIFVARDPDPRRFSGAALRRYKDVYHGIATGKIAGLSIGGAYKHEGQGRGIKHWALGEVSITDRPCLPSATFRLRH
jgi:phage head maturation protease